MSRLAMSETQLKLATLKLDTYRAATAAIGTCKDYPMASQMGGVKSISPNEIKVEAERLWTWMTDGLGQGIDPTAFPRMGGPAPMTVP